MVSDGCVFVCLTDTKDLNALKRAASPEMEK